MIVSLRRISILFYNPMYIHIQSMIHGATMEVLIIVREHILMNGVGHDDTVRNKKSQILHDLLV